MKIGIDIHGVVTKHKKFFKELSKLFISAGHEVHVLTGSSVDPKTKYGRKTIKEIEDLGIEYTHLFSIIDYHHSIGTEIEYEDSENPWMDGVLWDKAKGDYCKEHEIDIMFDDTRRYGDYFSTPFVHFLSIKPE
jgi:hypothetical protein